MSSLAWIDFDEAERQRAQRIMALFQEWESRDELGLGAIRDSVADHLFPGTSTIQTRLRYMLFVPWILRRLEGRDGTATQLAAEGRAMEIRLSDALKAGGESDGIIGRLAGSRLQRLPSSVYWAGLGAWGIRQFPGNWHPGLPAAPTDLLETASFTLTETRPSSSRMYCTLILGGAILSFVAGWVLFWKGTQQPTHVAVVGGIATVVLLFVA